MGSVAVIITCFNQAHYLVDAIESVLSQAKPPEQIIVVDDGSWDETAAVARQYEAIQYFFQENKGLAAARNTGLRHVSSDYVLFLDSDDCLRPAALEYCVEAISKNPEAAMVYGGFWTVDKNRGVLNEMLPDPQADYFAALLRGNPIAMHGTVMYRARTIRNMGGFDESLRRCEDYDLYLRLAYAYPLAIYRQIAAEYRQHGLNMTQDAPRMLKAVRAVHSRYGMRARERKDWWEAFSAGRRYWSMYYGWGIVEALFREFGDERRPSEILRLFFNGLVLDRRFPLRVLRRLYRTARLSK